MPIRALRAYDPCMTRRAALLIVLVAALCGIAALSAEARGPAAARSVHPEPLETLASRVAQRIAGRPVKVHCETWEAWKQHSTSELGFVRTTYDANTKIIVEDAKSIELSPRVCHALRLYALAPVKPTTCHRAGEKPGPCFTAQPVSPDDPGSALCFRRAGKRRCYAIAADRSAAYWAAYDAYVQALQTLAHEAVHVRQSIKGARVTPDSLVETQAECWGMQWLSVVAQSFGDGAGDARSLASYFWLALYPNERQRDDPYSRKRPYWSAACKPGGKLDIRARGASRATWPN